MQALGDLVVVRGRGAKKLLLLNVKDTLYSSDAKTHPYALNTTTAANWNNLQSQTDLYAKNNTLPLLESEALLTDNNTIKSERTQKDVNDNLCNVSADNDLYLQTGITEVKNPLDYLDPPRTLQYTADISTAAPTKSGDLILSSSSAIGTSCAITTSGILNPDFPALQLSDTSSVISPINGIKDHSTSEIDSISTQVLPVSLAQPFESVKAKTDSILTDTARKSSDASEETNRLQSSFSFNGSSLTSVPSSVYSDSENKHLASDTSLYCSKHSSSNTDREHSLLAESSNTKASNGKLHSAHNSLNYPISSTYCRRPLSNNTSSETTSGRQFYKSFSQSRSKYDENTDENEGETLGKLRLDAKVSCKNVSNENKRVQSATVNGDRAAYSNVYRTGTRGYTQNSRFTRHTINGCDNNEGPQDKTFNGGTEEISSESRHETIREVSSRRNSLSISKSFYSATSYGGSPYNPRRSSFSRHLRPHANYSNFQPAKHNGSVLSVIITYMRPIVITLIMARHF